jgi:hypothetical protein
MKTWALVLMLVLGLLAVPLAAEGQQAGEGDRIGFLRACSVRRGMDNV